MSGSGVGMLTRNTATAAITGAVVMTTPAAARFPTGTTTAMLTASTATWASALFIPLLISRGEL